MGWIRSDWYPNWYPRAGEFFGQARRRWVRPSRRAIASFRGSHVAKPPSHPARARREHGGPHCSLRREATARGRSGNNSLRLPRFAQSSSASGSSAMQRYTNALRPIWTARAAKVSPAVASWFGDRGHLWTAGRDCWQRLERRARGRARQPALGRGVADERTARRRGDSKQRPDSLCLPSDPALAGDAEPPAALQHMGVARRDSLGCRTTTGCASPRRSG